MWRTAPIAGRRRLALSIGPSPDLAHAQQARSPDFDALGFEAAERLGEYIRVRTVNPPGNETAGARWLQQVLAREGIPAEIFESSPGRGNLYARLPGQRLQAADRAPEPHRRGTGDRLGVAGGPLVGGDAGTGPCGAAARST